MFVLVHGAGMGANCWERLLPFLDRPALAVDLPGPAADHISLLDQIDPAVRELVRASTASGIYSPELQGSPAERVGGDVVHFDTGHMAMVSAPHQVADIVNAL